MIKAMKTANALIPIESILYAERWDTHINIFIKGLSAPNNIVRIQFPSVKDAKQGLEELYQEMISE